MRLSDYMRGFEQYQERSTNLSTKTKHDYLKLMQQMVRQLGDPPLEEVTPQVLLDWHSARIDAGLAGSTLGTRHSALKVFLEYLDEFLEEPTADRLLRALRRLKIPKEILKPRRPPYVLETTQVERLLEACDAQGGLGVRDRAIISFMWKTGVRVSELCGLRIQDLDLHRRRARVTGKGDKTRVVFFDEACQRDIHLWLDERLAWRVLARDLLFISVFGRHLSPLDVGLRLKAMSKAAGLKKPIWSHLFRHTRLTALIEQEMGIEKVAVLAGHSNIQTTMRYFHPRESGLGKDYDRTMRRARGDESQPGSRPEPASEEEEP